MISIIVETGTINIEGGTIISNNATGVYNYSTGTIKITGGTVTSGTSSGIYNSSTGTIELGEKITEEGLANGEVPNITSPKITGATYGIQNYNGKFNFYDGSITGKIGQSIYLYTTEKENGYEIVKTTNVDSDGNELETETAILQKVAIAEITYNNEKIGSYTDVASLREAVNKLNNTDNVYTLKILANFSINENEESIVIPKEIYVKLDLNNKQIDCTNSSTFINNGTLTILDLSEEQQGNISNGKNGSYNLHNIVIQNKGKLNISSGEIISTGIYAENIDNEGDVRIEGGELITKSNAYGVYNKGTVKMIGGKITLTDTSSYYGDSYGIYNDNEGKVEITGGEIETGYGYGVYNNTGTVELGDAKIKKYGVFNNAGTINITGGEINVSSHRNGVTNWSKGTINISGGKIITSADGSSGVYNEGTINMTGGEITTKGGYDSGYANGIENYTGTVNIKEGTITTLKSVRNYK